MSKRQNPRWTQPRMSFLSNFSTRYTCLWENLPLIVIDVTITYKRKQIKSFSIIFPASNLHLLRLSCQLQFLHFLSASSLCCERNFPHCLDAQCLWSLSFIDTHLCFDLQKCSILQLQHHEVLNLLVLCNYSFHTLHWTRLHSYPSLLRSCVTPKEELHTTIVSTSDTPVQPQWWVPFPILAHSWLRLLLLLVSDDIITNSNNLLHNIPYFGGDHFSPKETSTVNSAQAVFSEYFLRKITTFFSSLCPLFHSGWSDPSKTAATENNSIPEKM